MRTQNVAARTNSIPINTLIGSLALAALSFVLTSCSSIDGKTSEYVGVPHYSHTDPGQVAILRSEPTRPHERVGEMILFPSIAPAPAVHDVEKKLRKEAAKIGADAVIVLYDGIHPTEAAVSGPYANQSVQTMTGHQLIAVAIKYKAG